MEYPPELLKEFEGTPGGYAWMSAKNPALLDYMGAEFILIGATPDLGACLSPQLHQQAPAHVQQAQLLLPGSEHMRLVVHNLVALPLDTCDIFCNTCVSSVQVSLLTWACICPFLVLARNDMDPA